MEYGFGYTIMRPPYTHNIFYLGGTLTFRVFRNWGTRSDKTSSQNGVISDLGFRVQGIQGWGANLVAILICDVYRGPQRTIKWEGSGKTMAHEMETRVMHKVF